MKDGRTKPRSSGRSRGNFPRLLADLHRETARLQSILSLKVKTCALVNEVAYNASTCTSSWVPTRRALPSRSSAASEESEHEQDDHLPVVRPRQGPRGG